VSVTEIREFKILPCKIDKDLIRKIGRVLESDVICKKKGISYNVNSPTRKISSNEFSNFTEAEWSNEIRSISIGVKEYPSPVNIEIDFKYTSSSKVTISSSDATWADGIAKQLERVFNENKLSYSPIVEHWYLKMILAVSALLSLSWALTYPMVEVFRIFGRDLPFLNVFLIIVLVGIFPALMALYSFLEWLFPRFEYGNALQKRIRKWIWALFVSSGFLVAIAFKFLGL
jgi:hypothetical protein